MIRLQVATYNMKSDKEKVKEFVVEHFNDGEGDMVHIALGNENFVIGYETWKVIGRLVEDSKDNDGEEDEFECDGNCDQCGEVEMNG